MICLRYNVHLFGNCHRIICIVCQVDFSYSFYFHFLWTLLLLTTKISVILVHSFGEENTILTGTYSKIFLFVWTMAAFIVRNHDAQDELPNQSENNELMGNLCGFGERWALGTLFSYRIWKFCDASNTSNLAFHFTTRVGTPQFLTKLWGFLLFQIHPSQFIVSDFNLPDLFYKIDRLLDYYWKEIGEFHFVNKLPDEKK